MAPTVARMDDLVEGALRAGWLLLRAAAWMLWEMWLWGALPDTHGGRAARIGCRVVILAGLVSLLVYSSLAAAP